jgi:uncharacterized protein (DUF2235 family)
MGHKRLIVCCDGTWNQPDSEHITNIEKIARTVQSNPRKTGGVYQLVYYINGVGGGGYSADRLLGGAIGMGLFHNVIACYRFLAQNFEPGDEIFIFGFSRGAYTARSLAGMLEGVGLLTKQELVKERLPWAVHLYRGTPLKAGAFGESVDEFKHDHCHPSDVSGVTFLGVFDTVGALGVPGFRRSTPRFHNVALGSGVKRARHAMAINETRLKFQPTFWELAPPPVDAPLKMPTPEGAKQAAQDAAAQEAYALARDAGEHPRVKQVWFEGAHSDIGGGYGETGLSDTTLLWMAKEAWAAGLVFDAALLDTYVNSGSDPICHDPLNPMYRLDNAILKSRNRLTGHRYEFRHGLRTLSHDRGLSIRVASSARLHYNESQGSSKNDYAPDNLVQFAEETQGFKDIVEVVDRLPEANVDLTPLGSPA